jgi:hypothetical protein
VANLRLGTLNASSINLFGTTGVEGLKMDDFDPNETVGPKEQVQQAVRPTPKALLSVRAIKDMEKAIKQMKLRQKGKK